MKVEFKQFLGKPSASKGELNAFKEGHIWRDIHQYISVRLGEAKEAIGVEDDLFEIKKLQGAIAVAADLLNLPDAMIQTLEDDEELQVGDEDDDE